MCKMQQIIQYSWKSDDPSADTQQKEIAQMFRVQQIIQSNSTSEEAPANS